MKEDVDIIDNYRSLPIGLYQQIMDIAAKQLDDIETQTAVIAVLTGLTEEEVLHLPIATYKAYAAKAEFLKRETIDNLPRLAKKYVAGKFTLVPVMDYRKLEAAQYIDYQTLAPEADRHIAELVSVILVPEGHRYNEGYDILEVQQAIREHMNVADGVAINAFFLASLHRSMLATLSYCKRELRKTKTDKVEKEKLMRQIQELEKHLKTNGLGLPA